DRCIDGGGCLGVQECFHTWSQRPIQESVDRSGAPIHTHPSTLTVVDTLSAFLEGPRARDAFILRSVLEPPWSLRIEDNAPLTIVAVVTGDAWVVPEHADPLRLVAGEVAIIPRCGQYVVADQPETPPQVRIHPG